MANSLETDPSLTQAQFDRRRRAAFLACVLSFLIDFGLGITAFINCLRTKSFVGFSYSVHTFMDLLCTGFVSWHLMTSSIAEVKRRDRLACCVIGALFVGSFLAIESRAIQSMITPPSDRPDMTVVIYSLIHIIAFTLLSIIKILLNKKLKSVALKFDTLNSIIGIIMVVPLLLWHYFVFRNEIAYLDDLVQVLMALFLFVAGGRLILVSIDEMNSDYARRMHEKRVQMMLYGTGDQEEDEFHESNSRHHSISQLRQPSISSASGPAS